MKITTCLAAALVIAAGIAGTANSARAAVEVVASTPELAAVAREVGGNLVHVQSLAKPDQNYHQVEAKPTDVMKVKNAEVFIRVGMDLDMWADSVLNNARNPNVQPGGKGYVDGGRLIRKLEVPTATINGSSGDIHVYGNPHYWFDPDNAIVLAYEIDGALRQVDSKNAASYDANYAKFAAAIREHIKKWDAELAPFKGKQVVAYHDEWIYFLRRFGLKAMGYLEPKPGIPPSGAHIESLVREMRAQNVKAVIIPSIYSTNFADLIGKEAGATVVVVPYSVGSRGTTDYFSYMDAIIDGFRKALS